MSFILKDENMRNPFKGYDRPEYPAGSTSSSNKLIIIAAVITFVVIIVERLESRMHVLPHPRQTQPKPQ